jgi:hypothetical protein
MIGKHRPTNQLNAHRPPPRPNAHRPHARRVRLAPRSNRRPLLFVRWSRTAEVPRGRGNVTPHSPGNVQGRTLVLRLASMNHDIPRGMCGAERAVTMWTSQSAGSHRELWKFRNIRRIQGISRCGAREHGLLHGTVRRTPGLGSSTQRKKSGSGAGSTMRMD